jgi:NAD/NADP transhydrogenase beta subunit
MSYQPQPAYQAQPSNTMGVTSMVLGIIGLVFSFIPIIGVIAWPLVILGIIFGGIGISKANQVPGMPKGMAVAGLACSLVGLAICLIWAIAASS